MNTLNTQEYLQSVLDTPDGIQDATHLTKTKIAQAIEKEFPSVHDKLTAFFKPYKDSLEVKGDEPISFERAKNERLGLGDVLELTGLKQAA